MGATKDSEQESAGEAGVATASSVADGPITEDAKKPSAIDLEREASDKVRKNKDDTEAKRKEMNLLPEEYLGYADLIGKTIEKQVGEHNYKIHFFQDAKQGYTSLGSWDQWDGPYDATFSKGTRCWDGPERSLKVKFMCGLETAILDVSEPSKCVYQAEVVHHGACDQKEFDILSGGVQVRGPREEL